MLIHISVTKVKMLTFFITVGKRGIFYDVAYHELRFWKIWLMRRYSTWYTHLSRYLQGEYAQARGPDSVMHLPNLCQYFNFYRASSATFKGCNCNF